MSLLTDASLIVTPNGYNVGKLYSVIPNTTLGDMDVVRATTATRVNSAGFIEIARTNLVLYSEEFNDASWNKNDATISANAISAPNGTLTADKLIEGTLNGPHYTNRNITNSNSLFSFSIFAKKSERNFLFLQAFATLPNNFTYVPSAYFNLDNGTVGTVSSATATIQAYPDGWYRCTLNCTSIFSQSSASVGMYIMTATANGVNSYLGNGTSGIFIWGAQAEAGETATEYIPTTTLIRTKFAGITQDGSSASNIPRIDYPPLGGCPSILVEPTRTNLVLYSEEFDNAYWARSSTTITSNNTTAPDGNTTADRLVLTGTSSTARAISRNNNITTVTTTVTFSTFVKYIDKQYLQLTFGSGFSSNFANFDLINGTVVGGTYGNAKIENYSNGWYRISITSTGASTTTCTAFIWVIDSAAALRAADSTSTGTSAYWIWGAQLEDGSNATSYIPTTTIALARNADVISDTGISSLIGQTEGTIFVEANLTANTAERRIITVSNGTENQRIIIWTSGTILYATFNGDGPPLGTFPIGTAKIALGYTIAGGVTTYSIKVNNNTLITGTAAAAPTSLSAINLGTSTTSLLSLNDRIKSVQLYKTALSPGQLANLTT